MPVPAYRMEYHLRSRSPTLVKKTAAKISAALLFGKKKT
jgi:hypothetical protein